MTEEIPKAAISPRAEAAFAAALQTGARLVMTCAWRLRRWTVPSDEPCPQAKHGRRRRFIGIVLWRFRHLDCSYLMPFPQAKSGTAFVTCIWRLLSLRRRFIGIVLWGFDV